ncbi:mediator of RNA polymerase II transcription subunit 15-like isoform X2 [Littorina saxatilis]|uniref:mediator of RNA polymerase II transcription subunit 15-like isoform X2 n=1 Tax=Littorina saxatilis TaxID=31220 RepID=UPI0038B5E149
MADPSMNQDWHSAAFRSRLVSQIDETMRQAQTPMGRSAAEMENHVYQKAQSREEYMALVARLIIHVKEYNSKNRGQQGMAQGVGMGPHGHMGGAGPAGMGDGQGGIPDPMNALQNLARQGGGQPPPQQQGMMGGPQHNMHAAAAQQRQQLAAHQAMMRGQMQRPQLQRQDAFIVTSPQNVQQMPGQGLATSANMQFQPPSGVNTMMNRQVPMSQMGPQGPMQQAYLQPGSQQAPLSVGSDMSPAPQSSPAPGLPSPSPQPNIVPSPANRGMMGVPSPSTFLNTPGNPPASVPSPGNPQHTSTEEHMYLEKLCMLSKYIDPLRRSVNNLEKNKDEDSKKNYTKMKNLLDILTDPNKRVSMQTLLRCEQALNNWHLYVIRPSHSSGLPPAAVPRDSGSNLLGQPVYDAIAANISSPTLNHTLQRTFGPAMSALLGERIRCPSPPRKRKHEEVEEDQAKKEGLSSVLQREIANLGVRFRVSLDPLHHPANKTIHLVCKLDDLNLPSVPPVLVTIPPEYPKDSPLCEPKTCPGYDASRFFKSVGNILSEMMRRMSDYSLTALLNAWEMSVRKACAPSLSADTTMQVMF